MSAACASSRRGFATVRPLPAWRSFGLGPAVVLVWTPFLLIAPALSSPGFGPRWLGWVWLAAVAAAHGGAVVAAYRDRRWAAAAVLTLLGVQTVLTVGTTAWYDGQWGVLFTLLSLAYGAVAPPRWAPVAVLGVTAVGVVVALWQGAPSAQIGITGLTAFLSGMATFGFQRLSTVIAELDATRQQLARQAVDSERLRFSRDLHDLLGHTLSVIVVKSEAIRRLLPGDPRAAAIHAVDVEAIGRRALVEVREAVSGYRDTDLRRELDRAEIALAAAGITLRLDPGLTAVPGHADALFGWVVREGVTNVVRHSRARHCDIGVETDERCVRLTVADDGRGGAAVDGAGIRGLRERLAAAGGEVTASPRRPGFRLRAALPRDGGRQP